MPFGFEKKEKRTEASLFSNPELVISNIKVNWTLLLTTLIGQLPITELRPLQWICLTDAAADDGAAVFYSLGRFVASIASPTG